MTVDAAAPAGNIGVNDWLAAQVRNQRDVWCRADMREAGARLFMKRVKQGVSGWREEQNCQQAVGIYAQSCPRDCVP